MKNIVTAYLVILVVSGVVTLVLLLRRLLKERNAHSISKVDRTLLLREVFHISVGITLFLLFTQELIGGITTLAISAVLLIGFEYLLVILRKAYQSHDR